METLGQRIRIIREKLHLSQEELAEKLGLETKMAISKYESNLTEPDVTKLVTLCKLGGVDPRWLLMGDAQEEYPIVVRESPDGYGLSEEFVYLPRYEVRASAGEGEFIQSEQIVDYLSFRRDWVRQELGADSKHLILIHAVGDSMEPTIHAGDLLLVDRSTFKIKDDSLYVIAIGEALLVKRVQHMLDGKVTIKSDNPAYQPVILARPETEQLRVIGRLIWIGRRF